ncbi:MAG: amidohydrolase family protein [Acidimicrobiaceae bacterium]|nr:amidohydrolase family protein [Acidimicrobiaceae bacterium]
MTADLVIAGGEVVDGTGAPRRRADVAVTGGRITEIGKGLQGRERIDAAGQVVAPGFIDIHTHYDAQVFFDPALTPSSHHGVTTVVAGNCGFSIAPTRPELRELIARTLENVEDMDFDVLLGGVPWDFATFPEYLDSVRRRGSVLNFGAYVGHTAVRLFVLGAEAYDRAATDDEVAAMAMVVREAMEAGAAGLATSFAPPHNGAGGKPVPSRRSDRRELEALLAVMAEGRKGVAAFAPGEMLGIDDLYDLQPRIGLPFTYGALLTSPSKRHEGLLELNRAGRRAGAQVWPQVTPRPLAFAFTMDAPYLLNVNPKFAELGSAGIEDRRRVYADPAWRSAAWAAFDGLAMRPRWDTYELDEGKVAHLAAEEGVTALDILLDAALASPDLAVRVRCIIANDDEQGVRQLLLDETCTLGLSDAGAHVGQLCDAAQASDFLGSWVRERELMPLEAAVRKLTGVQADLFAFHDRGYIRPGYWADVTVFDPDTVAPGPLRRLRDFPGGSERLTADAPVGIAHVLVNGVPIRRDGAPIDSDACGRPGHVVSPAVRS